LTTGYERDVIRPHALGRFRDLLGAVAEHPAMLFYLDNWLSSDPSAGFDRIDEQRQAADAIPRCAEGARRSSCCSSAARPTG
jgi:uncharacterized protein (DUF1800 family)